MMVAMMAMVMDVVLVMMMVVAAAVTVKVRLIVTYKHFLSDTGKGKAVSVTLGHKDAA